MLREIARRPARVLRPPRALSLIRDASPDEASAEVDWTPWHLEEDDDVGQSTEQGQVIQAFASMLRERLRELGRASTFVGADNFFAWVPEAPLVRVSPDVYTLEAPVPSPPPRMFETWRPGHAPPVFALEIVSDDWISAQPKAAQLSAMPKDYDEAPAKYALLGARELVVFDAHATRGIARAPRVPLQVFRRKADGAFVEVYRGPGPARADTIDAWLVATPTSDAWQLLRLARDPLGTDLVPDAHERADRADRRADEERRRADALEAELARVRAGSGG